jgi:glycosyltransferase involved in cell wall biosynthesis
LKIAFISHVLPADTAASQVTFYRHFKELKHAEFLFYSAMMDTTSLPGNVVKVDYPGWLRRITNTRLHKMVETIVDYTNFPPASIKPIAAELRRSEVDVIVTLAHGREAWLALACAQATGIPLISFFHDDFWTGVKSRERFFAKLAARSRICFCVSPRMLANFQKYTANARLLWPVGESSAIIPPKPGKIDGQKWVILHTGTIYQYLEEPILALARAFKTHPEIEFWSTGKPKGWSEAGVKEFNDSGSALGFLSREELRKTFERADVLLSITPFGEPYRSWVSSYFPSKVVEYSRIMRPIVVWAPAETAISDWAKSSRAALAVNSEDSGKVIQAIVQLVKDQDLRTSLIECLQQVTDTEFNPRVLQQQFEEALGSVVKESKLWHG